VTSETTSETWVGSPLYVAMVDALADCGLDAHLADVARITNASKWTDRDWPSPDRATRDRFHALWTAKAQAACGLDPRVATPVHDQPRFEVIIPPGIQNPGGPIVSRETRDVAIVAAYADGTTIDALSATYTLKVKTLWNILSRGGVLRQRTKDAASSVENVLGALPTTRQVPATFAAIRERLGITPEARTAVQQTLDRLVQQHRVVRNRVGGQWFYQKRPTLARQAQHQHAARRAA
jgi:hypothetical protein